MNERCFSLLSQLNAQEYYDFLKMALGMYAFQHNLHIKHGRSLFISISKAQLAENDNKNRQRPYYFAIKGTDNIDRTFHDAKDNICKTETFFDGMNSDLLECLLRTGKSNLDWAELYPSNSLYPSEDLHPSGEIFDPCFGKSILDDYLTDNRQFQFILGAGINHEYGIGTWDGLLDLMDQFVKERQRVSDDKESTKNFVDFKGRLANTNYIGPQLAENIDREVYFDILNNWLYKESSEDFNDRESTNLYQVVRIASTKEKCTVLTFNYDNIFELLAKSVFPEIAWATTYSGIKEANKEKGKDHNILHLHGYFPRNEKITKALQNSIVLSSIEYMQAYRSGRMFCYSNLVKQLHVTNLMIGNSISDYEEQKVLRQNIYNNPSEYQFMLTTKNNEIWMDRCQTVFLMQMGVIPVYFNSFDEMNRYLQKL